MSRPCHPSYQHIVMRILIAVASLCLIACYVIILPVEASSDPVYGACQVQDPDAPIYYKIDLVSTRKVPGSGQAEGIGYVSYQSSPFGISLTQEGTYIYDLSIEIEGLKPPRKGVYVAWVTTPDLKNVRLVGVLDESMRLKDQIDWNKFLVVISLEAGPHQVGERWNGPIVLRGLSKSGFMHTMAGHGPFEDEPCAIYGY